MRCENARPSCPPDYAGGQECAACGTRNPPGAAFCVTCGCGQGARPVADAPASSLPPVQQKRASTPSELF